MTDKERVEEVRRRIWSLAYEYRHQKGIPPIPIEDQIISLKDSNGKPMIAILSDDQSLPKTNPPEDRMRSRLTIPSATIIVQRDMLAANFRRVIKEE